MVYATLHSVVKIGISENRKSSWQPLRRFNGSEKSHEIESAQCLNWTYLKFFLRIIKFHQTHSELSLSDCAISGIFLPAQSNL